MSFFNKLFGKKSKKKEVEISSIADFWNWFIIHENTFYNIVNKGKNIEELFLNKSEVALSQLREQVWQVTGMYNDNTAELILTPDGNIKNVAIIEELVRQAPNLSNWKFTALKQPVDKFDFTISMNGIEFNEDNISFYSNDYPDRPDLISITIVHKDWDESQREGFINGIYIALENYLGELKVIDGIDVIEFKGPNKAEKELVPISKIKDFLIWREKEFIEKYEAYRYDTNSDEYASFEATTPKGLPVIAIMNRSLLKWDAKASHPWMCVIEIKFEGNENGMPNKNTYSFLNKIEEEIMQNLLDEDGYLNVGRQTVNSIRTIFIASIDFRKPSSVLWFMKEMYQDQFSIDFDIYKDKYWDTLTRFLP